MQLFFEEPFVPLNTRLKNSEPFYANLFNVILATKEGQNKRVLGSHGFFHKSDSDVVQHENNVSILY